MTFNPDATWHGYMVTVVFFFLLLTVAVGGIYYDWERKHFDG
jgi:hypothetical protein